MMLDFVQLAEFHDATLSPVNSIQISTKAAILVLSFSALKNRPSRQTLAFVCLSLSDSRSNQPAWFGKGPLSLSAYQPPRRAVKVSTHPLPIPTELLLASA